MIKPPFYRSGSSSGSSGYNSGSRFSQNKQNQDKTRVNERIRCKEIRLIDEEGNQRGIMDPVKAMEIAKLAELDLVEVAPTAVPPVCRIMDYSKFKYEQAKKEKEARKKQKVIHIKEIKLKPRIDQHDYQFKLNHMHDFLKRGDKVKVTLVFRGREKMMMNVDQNGKELLHRVAQDLSPIAEVESAPEKDRGAYVMILAPKR